MDRLVSFKSVNLTLVSMCVCMICGILFGVIFFRILGAENFGIYGAVLLLLSFYLLLEFSVGPFIVRELSSVIKNNERTKTDYIFFGLSIGILVAIFASVLFYGTVVFIFSFLSPEISIEIQPFVLSSSWLLLTMMVQLIISSFLNGLQLQHIAMNFNAVIWCLRIALGFLFIDQVNPKIETLINTHLVSILAVIIMQIVYLKFKFNIQISIACIKITENAFFSILHDYLNFTRKFYPATLLGFFYSSIDKIIFLRLMGSYEFGCYTLAKNISTGLGSLIQAVVTHAYPTLSSKVGQDKELLGVIFIYQAILLVLVTPISAVILAAPEYLMNYYSGGEESGVLVSKYLVFLIFGVFFSAIAAISSSLLVASGNEKFFLWTNFLILFCLGCVVGIGELIGLSKVHNQSYFIMILLIVFAVSPLMHVALSLVAEYQKLIPNTFKTIIVPLWSIAFFFLLIALFSKSLVGGSDLLRLTGVFSLVLIVCGFLVWHLRSFVKGRNLSLKKSIKN